MHVCNQIIVFSAVVPAKIIRAMASKDIQANEGTTVFLVCNATGYPAPTITWARHRRTNAFNEIEG